MDLNSFCSDVSVTKANPVVTGQQQKKATETFDATF